MASHLNVVPARSVSAAADLSVVLERGRARAEQARAVFEGIVTPDEAFELLAAGAARLVDVRTPEERLFVGYVPHSIPAPWAIGTSFTRNPHFIGELESRASQDEILLFMCRSGARSASAAEAAARAQFRHAFNILEGFEGGLDGERRRGTRAGWRFRGLPWIQN